MLNGFLANWYELFSMRNVKFMFILRIMILPRRMHANGGSLNITFWNSYTILQCHNTYSEISDQTIFFTSVDFFTGPKNLSQPCNACTLALINVLRGQSKHQQRHPSSQRGGGGLCPPKWRWMTYTTWNENIKYIWYMGQRWENLRGVRFIL